MTILWKLNKILTLLQLQNKIILCEPDQCENTQAQVSILIFFRYASVDTRHTVRAEIMECLVFPFIFLHTVLQHIFRLISSSSMWPGLVNEFKAMVIFFVMTNVLFFLSPLIGC